MSDADSRLDDFLHQVVENEDSNLEDHMRSILAQHIHGVQSSLSAARVHFDSFAANPCPDQPGVPGGSGSGGGAIPPGARAGGREVHLSNIGNLTSDIKVNASSKYINRFEDLLDD